VLHIAATRRGPPSPSPPEDITAHEDGFHMRATAVSQNECLRLDSVSQRDSQQQSTTAAVSCLGLCFPGSSSSFVLEKAMPSGISALPAMSGEHQLQRSELVNRSRIKEVDTTATGRSGKKKNPQTPL